MIELECLGPPTLRVDGKDPGPELLWRKNFALLVYLALPCTRDHLMALLWPEDWMLQEKERLRGRTVSRLVAEVQRTLDQGHAGRADSAAEAARQALALDPYHEPALRILLRALALQGARALSSCSWEPGAVRPRESRS